MSLPLSLLTVNVEDDVSEGALDSLPCWGFLFLLATQAKSPYRSAAQCTKALERHWGEKGCTPLEQPYIHGATLQSREEDGCGTDDALYACSSPSESGGVNDLCVCVFLFYVNGPALCMCVFLLV